MNGLEVNVPERGAAADCYAVACTAITLQSRKPGNWQAARHAVTLHRLSGQLHRIAERQCNEDLGCRACGGSGYASEWRCACGCETFRTHDAQTHRSACNNCGAECFPGRDKCRACAGTGSMLGKREARIERQAREIAAHYGLVCYFQGDPRGCSLYLIDPNDAPAREVMERDYRYPSDSAPALPIETLRARWIEANYNRGHAVVRLGR